MGLGPAFSLIGKLGGAAAPPVPGPTVTAVLPDDYQNYRNMRGIQTPAGGNTLNIEGEDFVDGCTVTFKQGVTTIGTSPSVTFIDEFQIQAVTPALATGMYNLVVTNPDTGHSGDTGLDLHESWEPIAEEPTLLCLPGDYAVTGSQGIDAVGVWEDSSGNAYDLDSDATGGTDAPIEEDGCPVFVGADSLWLANAAASIDGILASGTAGSLVAFVIPHGMNADEADNTNAGVMAGNLGTPTAMVSSRGYKCSGRQDGGGATYYTAYADYGRLGEASLVCCRWTAANIIQVLNDRDEFAEALPGGIGLEESDMGYLEVGRSLSGAEYLDAKVTLVAAFAETLTDEVIWKFHAWGILEEHLPASYFGPTLGLYHWIRPEGAQDTVGGGTPDGSTTSISGILDNVGDDLNKSLVTRVGSNDPTWYWQDPDFGQRCFGSYGVVDDTAFFDSGLFDTPLEAPFTAYDVIRLITPGGTPNTYYPRIDNGGSAVGAALFGTEGSFLATTGGASMSAVIPLDETGVSIVCYDGASSETFWNRWNTPDFTGDTGSGLTIDGFSYASYGGGAYPGEPTSYKRTEFIIVPGHHNAATRLQYVAYLQELYQFPVSPT